MNVVIRLPNDGDFGTLSGLRNDPEIQRQLMIRRKTYSPDAVHEWISRRTNDPNGSFFVIDASGPCGFIQLTDIDEAGRSALLGICTNRHVWGSGVAARALNLLCSYAQRDRDVCTLRLQVLRVNHRAIRFYERENFEMEETRRREHFDGDSWRDVVLMKKRLAPGADFE